MSEFWFARRFPIGNPRNAMAPVSPEGWRVVWIFVGCMVGGAVLALVLAALGAYILGFVAFVGLAIAGAWYFIKTANARGDTTRTVDDYKRMARGGKT